MHLTLLVPAPLATIGGGYGYDRAILDGLRADGHGVAVAELGGRHPLPDDAAHTSAAAAWDALAPGTLPVIDAIGLPAFAPLIEQVAARRSVALVHHPVALEPHHDAATRAALAKLEATLLPRFARVIVTSAATGERLVSDFGVARERIAIVVPGTPHEPRSPGSGGSACEILSIGVLTPRKGHDVLLRALAALPDLDWRLTIAGGARNAEYAAMLPRLIGELGVGARVTMTGDVVDAALDALWQRADLFALASQYEGYGMAIAEALRRGLPVAIAEGANAGGLVTPQNGTVTENGDAPALSRALRRLIFDRQLRAQMAEGAWQSGRVLPDWPAQARAFAAAVSA
jgi:glycosyltransferase involved in cell wall biosynthesis